MKLLVSLLLLVSCAHDHPRVRELKGSFAQNQQHLELWNSFAFAHGGSEYYFARIKEAEGPATCSYFVGFKDGSFAYSFPTTRYRLLNDIYSSDQTVAQKSALAVAKIEDWKSDQFKDCTKEDSLGVKVLTLVVYSPAIVVTAPIWMATMLGKAIDDVPDRMAKLRLQMPLQDVKKLLRGLAWIPRKEGADTFYVVDHRQERLVMYFKGQKLQAWVRGLNPDLWKTSSQDR